MRILLTKTRLLIEDAGYSVGRFFLKIGSAIGDFFFDIFDTARHILYKIVSLLYGLTTLGAVVALVLFCFCIKDAYTGGIMLWHTKNFDTALYLFVADAVTFIFCRILRDRY